MTALLIQFLALFLISGIASTIGPLLLWRKSIFLLDAVAHAAIFAFAIAHFSHLPFWLSCMAFSMIFAILLTFLEKILPHQSMCTIIFLTGNFLLLIGISLLSLHFENLDPSYFEDVLLGDVQDVDRSTIILLSAILLTILILLKKFWKKILIFTIDPDFFKIQGGNYYKYLVIFYFLTIIVVTFCLKIIGAFLVIAVFLLPVITASKFAKNPLQLILISLATSMFTSSIGMIGHWQLQIKDLSLLIGILNFALLIICSISSFARYKSVTT